MKNFEIEKIIETSANKFGRINLSSGNCGKFALALGEYLAENGIESKINILFKYHEDQDVNTIDELAGSDPDVYHVVLSVGDKIYDGTGETSIEKLLEFSVAEYKDFEPMYMKDVGLKESSLEAVVEFDTNWSIDKSNFLEFFKGISKIENKKSNRLK